MERSQFTFYKSFADAIQRIRKPADRAIAYDIIIDYALNGTLPDLDNLPDSVCIIFDLVRPNLDTSRRKAKGGMNGRKKKDEEETEETEEEESEKTGERSEEEDGNKKKKEKKKEKEKEGEIENEIENECYKGPLTPQRREQLILDALSFHGTDLLEAVRDWIRYKIEKRQPYKETGLKSMLTQIEKNATEYGDQAMVEVIRNSMSSNYQGIVFDRLKGKPKAQGYGSVGAWLNGTQ